MRWLFTNWMGIRWCVSDHYRGPLAHYVTCSGAQWWCYTSNTNVQGKGLLALPQGLVGAKCCHKADDSDTTGTDFVNHSSWHPQWHSCPLSDVEKEHDFFSCVWCLHYRQSCTALWYGEMYCMPAGMSNRNEVMPEVVPPLGGESIPTPWVEASQWNCWKLCKAFYRLKQKGSSSSPCCGTKSTVITLLSAVGKLWQRDGLR